MNPSGDYSAAALVVRTDDPGGLAGHAHVFTLGRGNDIQLGAVRALEPYLAGRDVDETIADLGGLSRELVGDSPLRWLGPERGVMHMAIGAVLNACWDLAARRAGKPLWQLLSDLTPEQIVDLVDFRYLTDAMTRADALELLERSAAGKAERTEILRRDGYPAYATSPGWLGYSDERMAELCAAAVQEGFTLVKLKVGARLEDDLRRCAIAREVVGADVGIAVDANQVWDVPTAIPWVRALAQVPPVWIEEPTSPDDILGTAAIRRAVSPDPGRDRRARLEPGGLQAVAAGRGDRRDADRRVPREAWRPTRTSPTCCWRQKFGVPVCLASPGRHVGLCEMVQHLSMFVYAAVSGTMDGRMIEWIDHLHERTSSRPRGSHPAAATCCRPRRERQRSSEAGVGGRVHLPVRAEPPGWRASRPA